MATLPIPQEEEEEQKPEVLDETAVSPTKSSGTPEPEAEVVRLLSQSSAPPVVATEQPPVAPPSGVPMAGPSEVPSIADMSQLAMRQMASTTRRGYDMIDMIEQLDVNAYMYSSDRSRMHPKNTLCNQLKKGLVAMFCVLPLAVLIGLIETHEGYWDDTYDGHYYDYCHWYNYTWMFLNENYSASDNYFDDYCIAYEFEVYSLSGAQLDADNCNNECAYKFEREYSSHYMECGALLNTANGQCKCAVLDYYYTSGRLSLNYTCQSFDNYTRTIASQGYARDDVQLSMFECYD